MKGLAYWDGNVLRHTDPNGSRKMTAQQLAKVWKQGLPEGLGKIRQKEAFFEWVRDSGSFYVEDKMKKNLIAGTDMWHDFSRLVERIENAEQPKEVWRGIRISNDGKIGFLSKIERKGYHVSGKNIKPADSWTSNERAAINYATGKDWKFILRVRNPQRAKDITPLVRVFEKEIGKQKTPSVSQDAEFLYAGNIRLRFIRKQENKKEKVVYIDLEEEPSQ